MKDAANKKIKTDRALQVIDKAVPQYLSLASMGERISLGIIGIIFNKYGEESVSHIQDQWRTKKGEFGSFYLNLDDNRQRTILEYFRIKVEPDKYPTYEERMYKIFGGADKWEVYPFETTALFHFLLMANNNSLEQVREMEHGEKLFAILKKSKLDCFGTGTNWGHFYEYLADRHIMERKAIVEYSLTDL